MISEFKNANWSDIANSNDLINFESQSEGKISANYKGIGKSPELEGELSALNEPGDVSGLIKHRLHLHLQNLSIKLLLMKKIREKNILI